MSYPWFAPVLQRLPARLPAALLLSGKKGLGKEATALSLAQARLCEHPTGSWQGCGACASCHLFAAGNHPDFRLLTPASESSEPSEEEGAPAAGKQSFYIRIEAVREVAAIAAMTSHRGVARVVVICPAELLYPNAAVALLKILEEPPPGMHFLLVAHEARRLPRTIVSRCFRLNVGVPAKDSARAWLQDRAGGRADLALAMAAFAPVAAAELAPDEDYWARRRQLMDEFWRGDGDPLAMAQAAEAFDPAVLAAMLQMCCHDLMAAGHGLPVRYHSDYEPSVRTRAARCKPRDVARWQDEVLQFARSAYHPLNRRLALEGLFAALPS